MTPINTTAQDVERATERRAEIHTVLQRTVCIVLACHGLGNDRNVSLNSVDLTKTKADGSKEDVKNKDEYRLRQKLVDKDVLKPARSALNTVKMYLQSVATQGHRVFGAGTYLVAVAMVSEVEAKLKELQANVHAAGLKVANEWDEEVERRRKVLGPTFNAADYPRREDVLEAFDIDWSYVSFSAPDRLVDIDVALAQAATAKHEAKLAAAFDEIVIGMRQDALTMVTELLDRLGNGHDGKPKVLRPTALRDLQAYMELLPRRNSVAGDDALVNALVELQAVTQGVNVDTLRDAPAVRRMVREKAEAAAKVLTGLVETGARGIVLGKGGLAGALSGAA